MWRTVTVWYLFWNFTVFGCLCMTLKTFQTREHFQANTCRFLFRENMTSFLNYVTATLRTLFAWSGSFIIVLCTSMSCMWNYSPAIWTNCMKYNEKVSSMDCQEVLFADLNISLEHLFPKFWNDLYPNSFEPTLYKEKKTETVMKIHSSS